MFAHPVPWYPAAHGVVSLAAGYLRRAALALPTEPDASRRPSALPGPGQVEDLDFEQTRRFASGFYALNTSVRADWKEKTVKYSVFSGLKRRRQGTLFTRRVCAAMMLHSTIS